VLKLSAFYRLEKCVKSIRLSCSLLLLRKPLLLSGTGLSIIQVLFTSFVEFGFMKLLIFRAWEVLNETQRVTVSAVT
jgi:hypothetical protein